MAMPKLYSAYKVCTGSFLRCLSLAVYALHHSRSNFMFQFCPLTFIWKGRWPTGPGTQHRDCLWLEGMESHASWSLFGKANRAWEAKWEGRVEALPGRLTWKGRGRRKLDKEGMSLSLSLFLLSSLVSTGDFHFPCFFVVSAPWKHQLIHSLTLYSLWLLSATWHVLMPSLAPALITSCLHSGFPSAESSGTEFDWFRSSFLTRSKIKVQPMDGSPDFLRHNF